MSVQAESRRPIPSELDTRLPFWRQVRWNLIFGFMVLVVVPLLVVALLGMWQFRRLAEEQALNQLESVTELKAQSLHRWLADSQSTLDLSVLLTERVLASGGEQGASLFSFDDLYNLFSDVVPTLEFFEEVFVYNADGQIIISSNEAQVGKIVSRQPYYEKSLEEPYIQPPYLELGTNRLTAVVTHPLVIQGIRIGILAGRLDMDVLENIMLERAGLGDTGETYLVSADGNYLLTPSRFAGYERLQAYHSKGIDEALAGGHGSGLYTDYRGQHILGVYRWIPELQAGLLAEIDQAEALGPLVQIQYILLAVIGMVVAFAIGLGTLVVLRVSRPVTELAQIATRIARGDFSQRAHNLPPNELGVLGRAFNYMADQIQSLVSSLEDRVAARTRELTLTVSVGQLVSRLVEREALLSEATEYIRAQFDLYYVQVYLLDDAHRSAVLAAGTGDIGRTLLERGHRLALDDVAIVTRAAVTRRPVLVSDTLRSAVHKPNPMLPETRSEVAIPLVVGGEVLGVLDMQSSRPETFRDDNLPVFEAMAGQLASALRAADAYEQMREAVERAEAINRRLISAAWEGYLGHLGQGKRVGVVYDLNEVRPLTEDRIEADDPSDNGHAHELVRPLKLGDQPVGAIAIQDDGEREWTPEEIRLIEGVGERLALALEQYRAFDESERRAAELETVAEVSAEASTALDPEALLWSVSNLTRDHFGLYHAHIYLLDEEQGMLYLAAGAGDAGRQMVAAGHRIPLQSERSLVARAARSRVGVVVNDVTRAPDFLPNPLLPRTRSEMAIPMVVGERLIGVMDVQSDRIGRFTEDDVTIHTTLAAQIAIAVQNARLYSEQVDMAEQLREVDRLKSEFLASMSHELRTPLNSIIGYAEVLLDGIDGELNEEMQEDIEAIHSSGRHLLNLINDILDLAKIEAGQMDLILEDVDMAALVKDVVAASRVLTKDKPVELIIDVLEDLPPVRADSLRVRQIISNLVSNAIKFTEEGSVTVRADVYDRDPDYLLISCKDTGIGIPEEKLHMIFDRFRQADQSYTRRAGGTGLGLSISRQLVEMHGGSLWVESRAGEGATFYFTLPFVPLDEREA